VRRGVTLGNRPHRGGISQILQLRIRSNFLTNCALAHMVRAAFGRGFPRELQAEPSLGPNDPAGDDDRLDELGRRIDAAREHIQEAKPRREPAGRVNVVYRLSMEFVAAVFVGVGLGLGFDYVTGLKPVGVILGSILGIATAFYTVVRAMRQMNADADDSKGK
jgi:F0F1-type ATP synthase assembly protein I